MTCSPRDVEPCDEPCCPELPRGADFIHRFDQHFVLLDDASSSGSEVKLFAKPRQVIAVTPHADVKPALDAVRTAVKWGAHATHLSIREIARFKVPDRPSKLDPFADRLSAWLRRETSRPRKRRSTARAPKSSLLSF